MWQLIGSGSVLLNILLALAVICVFIPLDVGVRPAMLLARPVSMFMVLFISLLLFTNVAFSLHSHRGHDGSCVCCCALI